MILLAATSTFFSPVWVVCPPRKSAALFRLGDQRPAASLFFVPLDSCWDPPPAFSLMCRARQTPNPLSLPGRVDGSGEGGPAAVPAAGDGDRHAELRQGRRPPDAGAASGACYDETTRLLNKIGNSSDGHTRGIPVFSRRVVIPARQLLFQPCRIAT